ncbi:MOSC domain-containing protein [Dyadobacter psychrotolerans]|uniref:MOSC domain-containing protein n=1 Tax=Dyadobacter psychrotolerans TaxID=2541721 RepID=A0A4R5DR91_9BACT|nr:MOSC N-terminal beta barrel domain-containing protein [Dyadobacter psychrotolerans]TDE13313.1 MOSC domain-containing protein [Dyadobacter psychrotolerans]
MILSEIWIYPVKSLGGIRLKESEVKEKGLKYDRRWMVVDEAGIFLTQRLVTKMAFIDVEMTSEGLRLIQRTNQEYIIVPFEPVSAEEMNVKVWDDYVTAVTVCDEVDEWLSRQLERKVRLVFMPSWSERKADPKYATDDENVSFADGFPFLIISQGSLDFLNKKLAETVEMKRFRPNLVVDGVPPHAEDNWKKIQIGDLDFEIVKPCARCVLTTINPITGVKGHEPLKTLATYRRQEKKIMFGQDVVAKTFGTIREGDQLVVVTEK